MKQSSVSLLHSKMFLLPIRTSALALLLSLTAATAATATAEDGLTCRQEIPAHLIWSLWSRTRTLVGKLPAEGSFHRRMRLLPKFCISCPEAVGWREMREVVDVYQRSVFSREVIKETLPENYNDLLYRLQHTLQRCVSSSEPSKWFKTIRKLEKKIKKKKRDEGAVKAVGEFTFVLRWINELTLQHK